MGFEKKLRQTYGSLLWRLEESKRLVGIMVWLLTLSGIYLPYIEKELADVGVLIDAWILFFILMVLGFLAILIIGHIVAKTKLWQDDWRAKIQKNPFEIYLLRPKEKKIMENQLKIYKGLKENLTRTEFNKAIKELEGWIETGEVK